MKDDDVSSDVSPTFIFNAPAETFKIDSDETLILPFS